MSSSRIWCNSKTDSIVWMGEDNNKTNQCNLFVIWRMSKTMVDFFVVPMFLDICIFFMDFSPEWTVFRSFRVIFLQKGSGSFGKTGFYDACDCIGEKRHWYGRPKSVGRCGFGQNGQIIGEGYHAYFGGLHAERNAIANCQTSLEGATLFVTLEPCCHTGKTPPCIEAILEAGIRHVVIGSKDPNPLVAGKGIAQLRQAGVTVEEDFLKAECDTLNAPFFHYITKKQPYVAMKYAMTADGKIATTTGASQWVTNAESRRHVHTLRRKYMAILSGIGTVLADNPLLNCRLGDNGRNPIRIICDSHLRIPFR